MNEEGIRDKLRELDIDTPVSEVAELLDAVELHCDKAATLKAEVFGDVVAYLEQHPANIKNIKVGVSSYRITSPRKFIPRNKAESMIALFERYSTERLPTKMKSLFYSFFDAALTSNAISARFAKEMLGAGIDEYFEESFGEPRLTRSTSQRRGLPEKGERRG